MSFSNSPNMSLPIPNVGTEAGPQYATDINNSLTLVDQHDHSSGKGVQITPAGLNINAVLTFANNPITNLQYLNFTTQSNAAGAQSLYVKFGTETPSVADLWYNDGTNTPFQITSGGSVYAPSASIPGESYSAGTFIWKQGTGSTTPANFDIGSVIIRPNTAGTTNGITLSPGAALASSLTFYLPTSIPSVQSFLNMDTSGNIAASWTVDNSTIAISGNQLVAQSATIASQIVATQAQVNAGTATNVFVDPLTLSGRTNMVIFDAAGNYTWTAPAGVSTAIILGRGGAGGGGSGGWNSSLYPVSGAGGGGAVSIPVPVVLVPGNQYSITVGAGGLGGAAVTGNPSNGNPGGNGSPSAFSGNGYFGSISLSFNNIGLGGAGGSNNGGGTGTATGGGSSLCFGGTGGEGIGFAGNGANGTNSPCFVGGTGGTSYGNQSSPGGGGGAGDGSPNKFTVVSGVGQVYWMGRGIGNQTTSASILVNEAKGSNGLGGGGGPSSGYSGAPAHGGGNGSDGQIVIIFQNNFTENVST